MWVQEREHRCRIEWLCRGFEVDTYASKLHVYSISRARFIRDMLGYKCFQSVGTRALLARRCASNN